MEKDVKHAKVITEQGFSLAMMSGFGAAKIPASSFVTSQFFFRHRFKCLLLVYWSSMIFEGGGIYFFDTPYMPTPRSCPSKSFQHPS